MVRHTSKNCKRGGEHRLTYLQQDGVSWRCMHMSKRVLYEPNTLTHAYTSRVLAAYGHKQVAGLAHSCFMVKFVAWMCRRHQIVQRSLTSQRSMILHIRLSECGHVDMVFSSSIAHTSMVVNQTTTPMRWRVKDCHGRELEMRCNAESADLLHVCPRPTNRHLTPLANLNE